MSTCQCTKDRCICPVFSFSYDYFKDQHVRYSDFGHPESNVLKDLFVRSAPRRKQVKSKDYSDSEDFDETGSSESTYKDLIKQAIYLDEHKMLIALDKNLRSLQEANESKQTQQTAPPADSKPIDHKRSGQFKDSSWKPLQESLILAFQALEQLKEAHTCLENHKRAISKKKQRRKWTNEGQ